MKTSTMLMVGGVAAVGLFLVASMDSSGKMMDMLMFRSRPQVQPSTRPSSLPSAQGQSTAATVSAKFGPPPKIGCI